MHVKKMFLLDLLPLSNGLLKNCKHQIEFDSLQDVICFVSHLAIYFEVIEVFESKAVYSTFTNYHEKPILVYCAD